MARTDPRNRTRFWLDRRTPGLSLLRADFTTHAYAPHTHDALLVAVTDGGGSEITAGRVQEAVHRATLLVVNPGQPHSSRMGGSRRWRYRSLYLGGEGIGPLLDALDAPALPDFPHNVARDADLIDLFLRLHRASEDPCDPLRQRELLVRGFGALLARHGAPRQMTPRPPADRRRIARVVDLMRDQYADQLRLETLAAAAGLSPYQLIGLCRRHLGMSPHAYLTQIRLEAASRDLARGRPIAEAALSAGFYDQSALTNHFKRAYGITPGQYAAAVTAF